MLADPSFNIPQRIDKLIGAIHFFESIGRQQYRSIKGLIYQETKFGFVASKLIQSLACNNKTFAYLSIKTENHEYGNIEELIKQFWQSEEYIR